MSRPQDGGGRQIIRYPVKANIFFSSASRRALRPNGLLNQLASQTADPQIKVPELKTHLHLVLRLRIMVACN